MRSNKKSEQKSYSKITEVKEAEIVKKAAAGSVTKNVDTTQQGRFWQFVSGAYDGRNKYLRTLSKMVWGCLVATWVGFTLLTSEYLVSLVLLLVPEAITEGYSVATQTVFSAICYIVCLAFEILIPWHLAKNRTVMGLWSGFSVLMALVLMIFFVAGGAPVSELTIDTIGWAILFGVFYLVVQIGVPLKLVTNLKTTRDEMGVRGLPTWTDILLAIIGFIVAMIGSGILLALMQSILPGVDWEQTQDVGYSSLNGGTEMTLAFLALVVVAPIAEELIFRGWFYGKMRARMSAVPAIILTSVLFGVMHGQWNVGVVVFALSVVMCIIRELTGTIWGGILVHMFKNGLAFYSLYVLKYM